MRILIFYGFVLQTKCFSAEIPNAGKWEGSSAKREKESRKPPPAETLVLHYAQAHVLYALRTGGTAKVLVNRTFSSHFYLSEGSLAKVSLHMKIGCAIRDSLQTCQ